jgi:Asp-tRNA(Asn)/Glu-tRNA(Gln) amidotransferase A subunit family amidase
MLCFFNEVNVLLFWVASLSCGPILRHEKICAKDPVLYKRLDTEAGVRAAESLPSARPAPIVQQLLRDHGYIVYTLW